ncbi:MAG: hypothetical protein WKF37_15745 [Bryobacteraceae bacterium]
MVLVAVYLCLNFVVIGVGAWEIIKQAGHVAAWQDHLRQQHTNPVLMVAAALLIFPKLALGLSGFETGVAVMPLVEGGAGDLSGNPAVRIRNTRRLLLSAALIMSVFLLGSSLVTTLLIPPEHFQSGGEANGRALAFLAHKYLGEAFGTLYDLSTIGILWFAGASAMAGLMNLVSRYVPRYGMGPDWARASRPLVLVFTGVAVAITIWFDANVDAQAGAYATGVLVLMTSAALAVSISQRPKRSFWFFVVVTLVFAYTTIANIVERPEGLKIASFFVALAIVMSLVYRALRATELRITKVVFDDSATEILSSNGYHEVRLVARYPGNRDPEEYSRGGARARVLPGKAKRCCPRNRTWTLNSTRVSS